MCLDRHGLVFGVLCLYGLVFGVLRRYELVFRRVSLYLECASTASPTAATGSRARDELVFGGGLSIWSLSLQIQCASLNTIVSSPPPPFP